MSEKPVILIDGSSYLFRAYYALPALTNNAGEPTGAILGVMNMLKRMLKEYDPEHIVMVFDAKGKTFRHDLYAEYKANRTKMPDELRDQIAPLHALIELLGIPLIAVEGVEADDVIGTLTHRALSHGRSVMISTGDKDIAQLIQDNVTIIDTMKNVVMDAAFVEQKFGVKPKLIIDYLALMGDTSDNIPGVPKVGPKTAAKWLNEYGSLEALKTNADKVGGKVGENLRAHLDQLDLAKQLTTIDCQVDLEFEAEDFSLKPMQRSALLAEFKRLEFKSWIREFEDDAAPDSTPSSSANATQPTYHCILTASEWASWREKLLAAERVCFDTETTSLDALNAELIGIAFALDGQEAIYLPLRHAYLDAPEQLPFEQMLADIKHILENPTCQLIGQNLKYDCKVLHKYNIHPVNVFFDTMLASYVLDAGTGRHNLDDLAKRHLNHDTTHYEDIVGKGAKQISFADVDVQQATDYASEDAAITWQLYDLFQQRLAATPALQALFFQQEMRVLPILMQMEIDGVLIDDALLLQQSHTHAEQLAQLEQQAHAIADAPFNLSSPKQLREIFYDKMQLPIIKKTPKGQPSTNEEVLTELAHDHKLPCLILEHRHLSKLKSTYTDKLPQQIDIKTGRVHTHYHQAVANTGRLSSSDPNLQNIPIKTPAGREIRQAFIAPADKKIIAADYSQIELRIMAHLSGDAGLVKAFQSNKDIHRHTAAEVFGVTPDDVTNEQRRRAKAINFGLIYGMSAFGLAKQLKIGRAEAQQYIDTYFKRYPGVLDYMERTRQLAADQGYVETLFGRRLYLPDMRAKNPMLRKGAERAAINAPMQGTAADIIKCAMIAIHAWGQTQPDILLLMQVHDELVFECPETQLADAEQHIKTLMENAAQLDVPLLVEVGVGDNWEAAH